MNVQLASQAMIEQPGGDPESDILISVIVVSFNTREMTLRCIETVLSDCRGLKHEIWVVDNASHDGSAGAVRASFPEALVIENDRNVGFGAANNIALVKARGEFVFLLNSDAFVREGTVNCLLQYMRDHGDVAAVGPRLLNEDGSLQQSCYRFPSPRRAFCESMFLSAAFPDHPGLGDGRNWEHDSERYVDFIVGAACLVRRSAVEEVGWFDEDFFLYAEETDLCRRFYNAGWKVAFTPEAEVFHLSKGSGQAQADRVFAEFQFAKDLYFKKHYGTRGLYVYRSLLLIAALMRVTIFGAFLVVRRDPVRNLARFGEWRRILRWAVGRRGERLKSCL